jgi:hypothetical protein
MDVNTEVYRSVFCGSQIPNNHSIRILPLRELFTLDSVLWSLETDYNYDDADQEEDGLYTVAYLIKARTLKSSATVVARERLYKHVRS